MNVGTKSDLELELISMANKIAKEGFMDYPDYDADNPFKLLGEALCVFILEALPDSSEVDLNELYEVISPKVDKAPHEGVDFVHDTIPIAQIAIELISPEIRRLMRDYVDYQGEEDIYAWNVFDCILINLEDDEEEKVSFKTFQQLQKLREIFHQGDWCYVTLTK